MESRTDLDSVPVLDDEPSVPLEEVGVPVGDEDEPSAIDDTDSLEASMAAFEAGQLNESDFKRPAQPLPEEVAVFAPELPEQPEPAGPECELLLNHQQAERLLDSLDPSWRRLGRPPTIVTRGRGWFATGYSEFEVRRWCARRS